MNRKGWMTMPSWDARQYLQFERERTRPVQDLLARLPEDGIGRILDIGCGPGNSTERLADRYPGAALIGIDTSPDMLAAARKRLPNAEFRLCDAGRELPSLGDGFDSVFSNACLQWVPGHARVLPDMMRLLRPGGRIAVQIPVNQEEPIHRILEGLAAGEKWGGRLGTPRIFHTLTPEAYHDLLTELSGDFDMWRTTYYHVLPSREAILDWYRGTGLRPYLEALSPEERPAFEADVLEEVRRAYPARRNGEVLFPFPRLFFTAVR